LPPEFFDRIGNRFTAGRRDKGCDGMFAARSMSLKVTDPTSAHSRRAISRRCCAIGCDNFGNAEARWRRRDAWIRM